MLLGAAHAGVPCRLDGFVVHVGGGSGAWDTDTACDGEHDVTSADRVQHIVDCGGKRGSRVHIEIPGQREHLTLCEVQVCTGPPDCGMYMYVCDGHNVIHVSDRWL